MIAPYKRTPVPPTMAVLLDDGHACDEHDNLLAVDRLHPNVRVWASQETVSELVTRGHGEAMHWNGARIRWRPTPWYGKDEEWPVSVVQLPFPREVEEQLRGLVLWRDWLASYGASPLASLGSSSWSLLRTSLDKPLWTGLGQRPPLTSVCGGRIDLGCNEQGEYYNATQFDHRAAYAKTLGELEYGGRWHHLPSRSDRSRALARLEKGAVGFIRASVRIPTMLYGPLVERPTEAAILPGLWPLTFRHSCTLEGVWTWQELEMALKHGTKLLRIKDVWLHIPDKQRPRPFETWWARVQVGRAMPGLAGLLAKASGNALWGQFAITPGKQRGVVSYGRLPNGKPFRNHRKLPAKGSRPNSIDLAETITGRVRALAFEFMATAGEQLLSIHTDGGWIQGPAFRITGMRRKEEAERIQLLGPMTLRYWRYGEEEPFTVVSGWPPQLANDVFERMWNGRS